MGGGGLVGIADGEEQLPVRGELTDGVVAVVGEPHRVVGRDCDPVGPDRHPLAPRPEESAVAVEDDNGVSAPIVDVDVVVPVDGDRGGLDEGPALGESPPALDHGVARLLGDDVHWLPLPWFRLT